MLELKRKLGQQAIIANTVIVTVTELKARHAVLVIAPVLAPSHTLATATLSTGESFELNVLDSAIHIHLLGVRCGAAVIGFEAPRHIEIHRPDRYTGETHGED